MNLVNARPNLLSAEFTLSGVLYLLGVSICVLASSLISVAAPQTKLEQQKDEAGTPRKRGFVRGRVIYEDTRRPLRRVQVMIYDPAIRPRGQHLMAWTNGRGEFQFKDIPTGKYFVTVDAPGIIRSGFYDPDEAQRDLTSITVDGNSQPDVVVRVKRGGAVSGKVTYADGDPVINASIRVLRKKDTKWIPVRVGGGSTGGFGDRVLTDERGVYRISGLVPGEYVFGAAEEKYGIELTERDDPGGGRFLNRALLTATYYAGATNPSSATVLRVESGDEQTGINITLVERPVHSISGIINLKDENLPVARARISLHRKDQDLDRASDLEEPVVNSDEEGRFVFDEVYEGAYTITVTPPRAYIDPYGQPPQPVANPAKKFAAKHVELDVADSDLTNLIIEVSSGRRVSGIVTVDGGKPLPSNIFVFLELAGGENLEHPDSQTQKDGSFSVEGVPSGSYYVKVAVQPPNNDYFTKSVIHGRSDLTREPLTIKEDEDITNVRMVLSRDVARLSGRVLAADGKNPEVEAAVRLVSTDSVEQKAMRRGMYGVTNADGRFSVSGAPGEYFVIVARRGELVYQLRGDDLLARTGKAQRITLQAGENKGIELTIPNEK